MKRSQSKEKRKREKTSKRIKKDFNEKGFENNKSQNSIVQKEKEELKLEKQKNIKEILMMDEWLSIIEIYMQQMI